MKIDWFDESPNRSYASASFNGQLYELVRYQFAGGGKLIFVIKYL